MKIDNINGVNGFSGIRLEIQLTESAKSKIRKDLIAKKDAKKYGL